jgi:hypothetical protein
MSQALQFLSLTVNVNISVQGTGASSVLATNFDHTTMNVDSNSKWSVLIFPLVAKRCIARRQQQQPGQLLKKIGEGRIMLYIT